MNTEDIKLKLKSNLHGSLVRLESTANTYLAHHEDGRLDMGFEESRLLQTYLQMFVSTLMLLPTVSIWIVLGC